MGGCLVPGRSWAGGDRWTLQKEHVEVMWRKKAEICGGVNVDRVYILCLALLGAFCGSCHSGFPGALPSGYAPGFPGGFGSESLGKITQPRNSRAGTPEKAPILQSLAFPDKPEGHELQGQPKTFAS